MLIKPIFISLLMLSGCASMGQPTVHPISVSCIDTRPAKPSYAVDSLPAGVGILEKMRALLIERLQRKEYEAALEASLAGCI